MLSACACNNDRPPYAGANPLLCLVRVHATTTHPVAVLSVCLVCMCVHACSLHILRAVTLILYHEKKKKTKEHNSETDNTLNLRTCLHLTSQHVERFCVS